MVHRDQAVWFLNAYWHAFASQEAENIYSYVQKMHEIDPRGAEGNCVDEMRAHRFLESLGQTLTAIEMRNVMREIDIDFDKHVSTIEYLLYRYKEYGNGTVNVHVVSNSTPCDDPALAEQIAEASRLFGEAKTALEAAQAAAQEANEALETLNREQKQYDDRIAALEATGNDENLGVVKRNKAKAELAQMQAEDPLPLRRARINQGAAVRKAERTLKAAREAFDQADAYLHDAQERAATAGSAGGELWWIDRDLQEAKKYMPGNRGGITNTRGQQAGAQVAGNVSGSGGGGQ
jgi:hypothetical protein